MGNIVLLDDLTINKIAAGEVIERPASAVKEMVENSIDAGATNITVEIKNGGISYIRVTDNGKGIAEDDLDMAFERHATSKIRKAEDLDVVKSMGFRGEALASIAAISRVEMISKTADQQNGYKVVVEGGNILEKSETGSANGTTIIVTNLFFNTPVRYKFLRKDFTEAGYIEDAISRIALSHPEVAIKLISSGKTAIQTNGNGDLKTAIYSIYGKDVANSTIDVDYTSDGIHVYGVIGKPEIARSNRANQIFFINKRYVKDKILSSAVERSYKELIPVGKFAFLVLNLDMDSRKVDVNVHPAKLEVRFEDENTVFKTVYHAIKENLMKLEKNMIPQAKSQIFETDTNKAETQPFEPNINKVMPKVETNENSQPISDYNTTTVKASTESTSTNDGQDIIRRLQEMKEKLLKETAEMKRASSINDIVETEKEESPIIEQENVPTEKQTLEETESQEELEEQNITENDDELEKQNIIENDEDLKEQDITENQNEKEESNSLEEPITEQYEIKSQTEENETNKEQNDTFTPEFDEMYLKLFGTKPVKEEIIKEEKQEETKMNDIATTENISMFKEMPEYQKPNYKFIGIIFESYAILEIEKDMYILNQHAGQERILYEAIKESFYNDSKNYSQLLLIPDVITLSHKEMEIVKENRDILRRAGFIFDDFGENTIKVTEVPEMCADLETKELFLEILEKINSVARTEKHEIEEKLIQTIAKKSVEELRPVTSKDGIESLMEKLLSLSQPFYSADGTPIAIKMSKNDIEKKFARR